MKNNGEHIKDEDSSMNDTIRMNNIDPNDPLNNQDMTRRNYEKGHFKQRGSVHSMPAIKQNSGREG